MTYNIWAIQAIQNQLTGSDSTPRRTRERESDFLSTLRRTALESLYTKQAAQPLSENQPAAMIAASMVLPRLREVHEVDLDSLTSTKRTRRYIA